MKLTEKMKQYISDNKEELKDLIRAMSKIPAPSNKEEKRAAFCEQWFLNNGFEDVHIDSALNVIAKYNVVADNQLIAITAHTDTVFPDETEMPFREDDKYFYCPGVCDDTTQLAILMMTARYFVNNKYKAKYGILFVANSGEEGLGNLKGIRQLFKDYGNRIKEHITLDGTDVNQTSTNVVGSTRYKVSVKTEGGHSFGNYGRPNAIIELAKIIIELDKIQIPIKENTKTTKNIGTIEGGTSVNTIAQSASMLCEYRSNDIECINIMKKAFEEVFQKSERKR